MPSLFLPKVVIDTNVLLTGLTRQGGAEGLVVDAWRAELMTVCVSNSLAYEYVDVLSRKLAAKRWRELRPVLGALLSSARYVAVYYSWRPHSPDPGDEHIIDCAMNASAAVITWNVKDLHRAEESLGLEILTPPELLVRLADEEGV